MTRPNKSLATRDGCSSSAFAEDVISPACLSSGRQQLGAASGVQQDTMKQNIALLVVGLCTFAAGTVTLTGVAQSVSNSINKTSSSIVGTWHLVRFDNQEEKSPTLWRFYTNGTSAEWPSGATGTFITNNVEYGRYHFDGKYYRPWAELPAGATGTLITNDVRYGIDYSRRTGSSTNAAVKIPRIEINGDTMILVASVNRAGYEVGQLVQVTYHRLATDLEPGLVFTSFGGNTNEVYELSPLPAKIYHINGAKFMIHLKQLVTPKHGESNQALLLRYFKEQHIEIRKPATLDLMLEGDLLVVRTTAHDQVEIERLLLKNFSDD